MKPIGAVIFEIDDTLADLRVQYVLGGALALAYYAEPRGTSDIDVCVSTPLLSASFLVAALARSAWRPEEDPAESLPIAGTRFLREGDLVTLDVSFSFDEYHTDVLSNAVRKPFLYQGERRELPFLAADDLVVLKVSFGRDKDWVDIGQMVESGTPIDPEYVERQLIRFRGPAIYPRVARLRRLLGG